jgi:hypothetical protein
MDQADYYRLPTKYSFHVLYAGQADYGLNIDLMYAGIRWITNQIFIWCMNGSGRLLTEYSFVVCRDLADNQIRQIRIEYLII